MPNEEVIWIETYTGKRVNPLHLTPEDIDIKDIAHSLSLLCRFVGHCKRFYSVGQHSIHVSDLVHSYVAPLVGGSTTTTAISIEDADRTSLAALLHDSAEAYVSDLARPVKHGFKMFMELESVLLGIIMQKFNCVGVDWGLIKKMDNVALATEAAQLMPSKGDGWYLPESPLASIFPSLKCEEVEGIFLAKYYKLGGK